jgi:hypothetical protein
MNRPQILGLNELRGFDIVKNKEAAFGQPLGVKRSLL